MIIRHQVVLKPIVHPINLHTVWIVDANSSYDIINTDKSKNEYIAIRTEVGCGEIHLVGDSIKSLEAHSLMITNREQLVRYKTLNKSWKFHWFEFKTNSYIELETLTLKINQMEKLVMEEIIKLMPTNPEISCNGMQFLLAYWKQNKLTCIDNLAEQIAIYLDNCDMNKTNATKEIENHFLYNERTIRSQFIKRYGVTPTLYHRNKRLNAAAILLRTTNLKLSVIAEQCGYSNEYYFSKVFQKYKGVSPGKYRKSN